MRLKWNAKQINIEMKIHLILLYYTVKGSNCKIKPNADQWPWSNVRTKV